MSLKHQALLCDIGIWVIILGGAAARIVAQAHQCVPACR